MTTGVPVSLEASSPALSVGAVAHLAHDLRGGLHTILGHCALLALDAADSESRDSTRYIHDAADRVLGLCDDITDVLRLPDLVERGESRLSLGSLAEAIAATAASHGSQLRVREPLARDVAVVVDATVHRVVTHVVEHVVRVPGSDVALGAAAGPPSGVWVISIGPTARSFDRDEDGVMAMAAVLLAAHGGGVGVAGSSVELVLPVMRLV
jgi:hypothetical protein